MNNEVEMSRTESTKYSVEIIARAKSYTDSLPTHLQNADYIIIANKIDAYLKKYCVHKIITDSIDIDCDRSQTIHYCEICFQTFDK
jgi:hypothetical protein